MATAWLTIDSDSIGSARLFTEKIYSVGKNVDFDGVIKDIENVKGVRSVHNVHLWTLCSNINVIDAHILVNELNMAKIEKIKSKIKKKLEKYSIKHATLEFECEECFDNGKVRKIKH